MQQPTWKAAAVAPNPTPLKPHWPCCRNVLAMCNAKLLARVEADTLHMVVFEARCWWQMTGAFEGKECEDCVRLGGCLNSLVLLASSCPQLLPSVAAGQHVA